MRSIRAKLFVSIGLVFLIIAILSYLIPRLFIHRDIDKASGYLNAIYSKYQHHLKNLSSSWITYRFIEEAAQLSAVTQTVHVEKQPLMAIAREIIGQDPGISIVQISDDLGKTIVVSPESGKLHTPFWAKDQAEQLWIKFENVEKIYRAEPYPGKQNIYLLFLNSEFQRSSSLRFAPLISTQTLEPLEQQPEQIYEVLRLQERMLLDKANLIELLSYYEERAAGIVQISQDFQRGMAFLSEEIFFSTPFVPITPPKKEPFVVYRQDGPFVDLVQFATENSPYVAIGYSLSEIVKAIARTIHKPVILMNQNVALQAVDGEGKNLSLGELKRENDDIIWNNQIYIPSNVQIEALTFSVLIPEAESTAIQKVLSYVRNTLITKLSYNLLLSSIVLFAIALLLLARISKRITRPITQLALASEEIGKGKYENLDLPPGSKKNDEVAILSHSFQKMVVSLRDREKIRGVLNKVVSKEIASTILKSDIELGGELRILTMLFSDIRGFTPLSETLPPQKLINLLNTYMTRMCRIIDETHGVVDKFVGDEIMALYGAPLPLKNHAEEAIEAAILMIADLRKWNKERGDGAPQITVGIGIHTGSAYAGNMGAEDRLNYTVVGANVNLAARLCSAALPMQILVSEETYHTLSNPDKFNFKKLTPILLKGIETPVPIFEIT